MHLLRSLVIVVSPRDFLSSVPSPRPYRAHAPCLSSSRECSGVNRWEFAGYPSEIVPALYRLELALRSPGLVSDQSTFEFGSLLSTSLLYSLSHITISFHERERVGSGSNLFRPWNLNEKGLGGRRVCRINEVPSPARQIPE